MSTPAADRPKTGTILLVGCGQMGSAMLRGWLARGAAERFLVVEPAGAPAALAEAAAVARHRTAGHLPAALARPARALSRRRAGGRAASAGGARRRRLASHGGQSARRPRPRCGRLRHK